MAASVASALARSRSFQNLLFQEDRSGTQTIGLLAWICIPLTLGVWVRLIVPNFYAADIAFETVIILGVLLGPLSAMAGAALLAAPAMLHHEYLTLPFNLAVALIAGIYGRLVTAEEVWSFSPFVDLSIYRWVRRNLRKPRFDRQILLLMLILGMEIGRESLAEAYPNRLFALVAPTWPIRLAVYACSAMVVGIQLKIWNAIRIEHKLEEQKRLLLEARFDALQRQINPHFLFNTLNSIASLVRFRPEMAREMIVRLANILRALLKDHDTFVALREELNFTEDYLGIEVVRFGADKLHVVKDIDPATLEMLVPSMLLQPLIENSIKHGIEPRISGGTITMRSRLRESEHDDRGRGRRSRHGRIANALRRSPAQRHRHRHEECARTPGSALRRGGALRRHEPARTRNTGQPRNPRHDERKRRPGPSRDRGAHAWAEWCRAVRSPRALKL